MLIDATMARGGGGYTYVVNIVPSLVRAAPHEAFRLLVRSPALEAELPPAPNLEVVQMGPVSRVARFRHVLRDVPRMARAWNADLYFSVAEMVPLRLPCPMIASFRNPNVVERRRHHWPLRQRLRLATLHAVARLSGRLCERVLFVSEDSSRWMGDALRIPAAKRVVIHHGIDLSGWKERSEIPPHPRPYILSVSSIYRYKNYVRLIEAYAALASRVPAAPDLLIIGDDQDSNYAEQMEQARRATGELASNIHILGEVPYAQVKSYYAGAALFVFPSYLETFGHPLLESMASEVPLVASDIPVFREVAGDAAEYADPYQAEAIADAMERALDPSRGRQLVARGQARVRELTWARSTERHLALFREVAAPRPQRARG